MLKHLIVVLMVFQLASMAPRMKRQLYNNNYLLRAENIPSDMNLPPCKQPTRQNFFEQIWNGFTMVFQPFAPQTVRCRPTVEVADPIPLAIEFNEVNSDMASNIVMEEVHPVNVFIPAEVTTKRPGFSLEGIRSSFENFSANVQHFFRPTAVIYYP